MGELAERSLSPRARVGQMVQQCFHTYRPDIDASKILPCFPQALHGGRCRNVLPSRTLVR